jgi:hypothetical protein
LHAQKKKKKQKKKEKEESGGDKSEIYSGLIYDRAACRVVARADSPLAKKEKKGRKKEKDEKRKMKDEILFSSFLCVGIINGVENGVSFRCSRDVPNFEDG